MGICKGCDHDEKRHFSLFFERADSTRAAGARPCQEEYCDCSDFVLKPFFRKPKSTKSQQDLRAAKWRNGYL
jgi:hypothetical protein